jgi:hypothetical protein
VSVLDDIDLTPTDRVGSNPPVEAGVVQGDPATLAREAGVSLDEYALARMVASEEGNGPAPYLLAVAECAVNRAAHIGKSVSAMLLIGRSSSGKFGQTATGKWASTARPATKRSLAAAKAALGGSSFARGSRDFVDPAGLVPGRQEGIGTVRQTAKEYIAARAKEGLVWIGDIDGIDPAKLMLFADKSKVKDPDQNVSRAEGFTSVATVVAFMFLVGTTITAFIIGGKVTAL